MERSLPTSPVAQVLRCFQMLPSSPKKQWGKAWRVFVDLIRYRWVKSHVIRFDEKRSKCFQFFCRVYYVICFPTVLLDISIEFESHFQSSPIKNWSSNSEFHSPVGRIELNFSSLLANITRTHTNTHKQIADRYLQCTEFVEHSPYCSK